MMRLLALPLVLLGFHGSIAPLPGPLRAELIGRFWHPGCPVSLSQLRVLTVDHWGFDGRVHAGQLVVKRTLRLRSSVCSDGFTSCDFRSGTCG